MVCHVFCKLGKQLPSLTFPVRKFLFILMLLILLPLLAASGVQLLTSGDNDDVLDSCKGSHSHVNATCPARRAFTGNVTTLVDGKLTETMFLTNAFLETCAANPQEILPFSADLPPLAFLTTPPSPTREIATLSATFADHRGGLTTSLTPDTPPPRVSNYNSVSRVSSIPVRTHGPAATSPPEASSFGVRESCMIMLVLYTTAMLGIFCCYINKLEARRAGPKERRAGPEAGRDVRPHRRHRRYSRARVKDQAVSDALERDLNRILDWPRCVPGERNGNGPRTARIAGFDYTRSAPHGTWDRARREMFNYLNGLAGFDNNLQDRVDEMRHLNRNRRPPMLGNNYQCLVHAANRPPPVAQQEP